jgi:hypothetical protein
VQHDHKNQRLQQNPRLSPEPEKLHGAEEVKHEYGQTKRLGKICHWRMHHASKKANN